MNLTKIGVLLKNALGFGSKAIFIDLGKYFKTDRVQGFQREDQETVPQQSLPQITTPGNMEESPVVTAITRLIEQSGLHGELVSDTTTLQGWFFWKRSWGSKMRHIRFAPPPADWRGEYILSWFEKDGDKIHEGKWMGDLEHIVELFSRFLAKTPGKSGMITGSTFTSHISRVDGVTLAGLETKTSWRPHLIRPRPLPRIHLLIPHRPLDPRRRLMRHTPHEDEPATEHGQHAQ